MAGIVMKMKPVIESYEIHYDGVVYGFYDFEDALACASQVFKKYGDVVAIQKVM